MLIYVRITVLKYQRSKLCVENCENLVLTLLKFNVS